MGKDLQRKIIVAGLTAVMAATFAVSYNPGVKNVKAEIAEFNGDEGRFPWESLFITPSSESGETTTNALATENSGSQIIIDAAGNDNAVTKATESTVNTDSNTTTNVSVKRAVVKKAKINKKAKKISIKLKKVKGAAGYQIKVSTAKKFKKRKTKTLNIKKVKATVKKINTGKKYYIKARAFKKVNGIKVYGKWSKVKRCK